MSTAPSTIQVSGLAKQKLRTLHAQAKESGMTPDAYAKRLIEEGIALEREARTTPFDELYAPVQKRFKESGMTEDELDRLVDAARRRRHHISNRKKA